MPQDTRFAALRRLLGRLRPYRGRMTLVIVLGVIVSAVQPFCAKLTEDIIDKLEAGVTADYFLKIPLIIVAAFIVSGFAKYFHNTIRRSLAERLVCQLREEIFRKFLDFPLSAVQKRRVGEYLSSIQNDLVHVNGGLETICDLLKEPVAFVGLLGVAFFCDWRLALATLIVAPIVALLFSRSGSAVKRYTARTLDNFADILALGQESLVGAQVVKVFRLENALAAKFRGIQDGYFRTLLKSIRVQELATPAVELIGALLMAGVLAYGGYRISSGQMTSGQLIAFIIAIGLAQMPIKKLNNAFLRLKIAEGAAERVFGIIDTPIPATVFSGSVRKHAFDDRIEYRGVGLSYGEKRALTGVSLTVTRGERVAFVGPSGSGKTSLVHLLPRLYEVSEGAVLIDGMDIREYRLDDLRRLVSFVNQETFLFHDTIHENIRYGRPEATRAEIERAAELANCTPFIRRLPAGFETQVGDRGGRLSGGERQRIAIARAILKHAPILILDEATSNLDSESEAIVQAALERLMQGTTTLMIAHRFSTVKRADRIYVVESGRIEEVGSHAELVESKGTYSRLLERQLFL